KLRTDADVRRALEKTTSGTVRMGGRLGFTNTYALGMREEKAEQLGIRTISDLAARGAGLNFRFSEEFTERPDGWHGLRPRYRFRNVTNKSADHSLAYRGLASGSIDVTDVYSTDPEIQAYGLRVLEDNRGFFPAYYCVWLYRAELEQRAPRVVEMLKKAEG